MELILHYFPDLTERQIEQLSALGDLYREWNQKINVISRKDIDHLYEHHVLHSLALAKYNPFATGMQVLDAGTGGGFPGIPLAILFPEVHFTLLDATAKKIHVARQVAAAIELENVTTVHSRLEDLAGQYDIMMSRAVSTLAQMMAWSERLMPAPRWVMLKGGEPDDIPRSLSSLYAVQYIPVSRYFEEDYFAGKYIADVTMI